MSDELKDNINKDLKNSKILSHREVGQGVHELEIEVGEKGLPAANLAYLTGKDGQPNPVRFRTSGSEITRDYIRRTELDLLFPQGDPLRTKPEKNYAKALDLYRSKGAYAQTVDTLTNFACKGFKNDIDDPDIKLFYDTWVTEIGFRQTIEKIIFDFFRVGMVRTLKIVGKFDPKLKPENFQSIINNRTNAHSYNTSSKMRELIAYHDIAAAKKTWSKAYVPLRYTVLNPVMIMIQGPLLFDETDTYLRPEAFTELRDLIRKAEGLSPEQRKFISTLPKELRDSIQANKPVKLPRELVGRCDYRKQDYERYPFPRVMRAFDDLNYKHQLQQADYSTLDGITNYILKITIGNDQHPVTNQADLETVARLFDTPSKSFDVVWNHTLDIEKVTFPEIREILGQDKFKQVNDDLSVSFGVTRALLDGQLTANSKAVEVATKAFTEEINYARRCITDWINGEYEEIALAMGFSQYPRVRFDDLALKDEILMMSIVQGMIDRRILSYETGIEKLGFDFPTELANMRAEMPLVQEGVLGIIGSPYNPKALPPTSPGAEKDITPSGETTTVTKQDLQDFLKNVEQRMQETIQKTQRTPTGTPSEGRPRKGRGKPRQKSTTPQLPQP